MFPKTIFLFQGFAFEHVTYADGVKSWYGTGQNRQIDHNYHDDMDKIVVHVDHWFFLLIICKTKKTFNRLVLDRALKFLFIVRASFPRNEGQTPQIRLRFPQAVLRYPPKRKIFSLDDLFVHRWTLCLFNNKDSSCRGAVCLPRKNCRPRTKQPTDLSLLKPTEFFHFAWPTIWKLRWAMQAMEEVLAKLQQDEAQLISSPHVFVIEATNHCRIIRVW